MHIIYILLNGSLILVVVVEPASNLEVQEVASKSMRLTWGASLGEVTGYKIQLVPMMAGSKRQELYVGPTQTSVNVKDLSPDTEYEISLFALRGLTPSEPIIAMQKTEPLKISLGKYEYALVINLPLANYWHVLFESK